ncbi:slit homolog 2 protein-like [Athalia rosae]|uniref:slit homolog 2 protein-like n=1 Tax=Athalia rosae TaxID=37344 RepID=UPI002033CACE|nr:slit homolog 2 protein-like [Athalia rosae]XP_048505209.1 slit homolog 2 protein-like [Athalia rosae]XP_048505210.1 slit homolog 2 protein-like [Athalia rosae]XP_048505211.1 slit homolog 2 protein-like [Athalia rosae]XP_048505212.1 slit homolog 2 protein-like [Athalia rosae]XP_048505213.1 slit homolog 2 protein-like [Athalia rosae]XP_048505214.1 slit homolog 2 protein-like [Athalia rosae]
MAEHVLTLLLFILATVVPNISARGGCKLVPTDDPRDIVYSCVEATLNDLDALPSEAQWIQLSVSKLEDIPKKAFARFALRKLSFYNCDIRYIDPAAFEGLKHLEWLTIYGSNVPIVKSSWFEGLKSLTHLSLEKNKIAYIEPDVFTNIPRLELLNIEDNNLNCLAGNPLPRLRNIRHVRIGKNPWMCTCYTELVRWLINKQINFGSKSPSRIRYECMADSSTLAIRSNAQSLTSIREERQQLYETSSSSENRNFVSSRNGNVLFTGNHFSDVCRIPDNVQAIKFSGRVVSEIPAYAFIRFGNTLRSLDLSNSSIGRIDAEAFAGLPKLEQLILSNNGIAKVRAEWFRDLHSLKDLVLDNNRIEHIDRGVFEQLGGLINLSLNHNAIQCLSIDAFSLLHNLKKVNIRDNSWTCNCQEGFTSWLLRNQIAYEFSSGQCKEANVQTVNDKHESQVSSNSFGYANGSKHSQEEHRSVNVTGGGYNQSWSSEFTSYRNESQVTTNNNEARESQNGDVMSYEYYTKMKEQMMHDLRSKQEEFQRLQKEQQSQSQIVLQQRQQQLPLNRKVIQSQFEQMQWQSDQPQPIGETHQEIRQREETWRSNSREYASASTSVHDSVATFQNSEVFKQIGYARCQPVTPRSSYVRNAYECVGGTLRDLDRIPEQAESIKFENALMPVIPNDAFYRFGSNLRILELSNCSIQRIEPQAFSGLVNLQELILNRNYINEVLPDWFVCMSNLERLSLSQNSITRITPSIYPYLINLRRLDVRDNQINCFGADPNFRMPRLQTMDIGRNPWSCLCLRKMIEWMNERRIVYNQDVIWDHLAWDCIIPGFTNPHIETTTQIIHRPTSRPARPITLPPPPPVIFTTPRPPVRPTVQPTVQPTVRPPLPPIVPPVAQPSTGHCNSMNWDGTNNVVVCVGGDLSTLFRIDDRVESIEIVNASMFHLPADVFKRFVNLKRLRFQNCSIQDIDPLAFSGLHKLESLDIVDNYIPNVKSIWFHDMASLTELRLDRNHIVEIEADLFEYLRKLRVLSLRDNGIQCIYTRSLYSLDNLKEASLEGNRFKWRCFVELSQFLNTRNVSHVHFESLEGGEPFMCDPVAAPSNYTQHSSGTNTSTSTVNVLCASIAMLIFTKF